MLRILRLSVLVMVFFVSGIGAAFADQQVNNNTPAMLEKAFQELKQADEDLTYVYEQILEKHKGDMVFVEKLTKAQAAWVAFRNAELEAIFPAQDKKAYGSTYPLAYAQEKSRLILKRVKELTRWLDLPEDSRW